MTAKFQVFISSTYEDLRGERDQVIKAVLEMGHIPVGMEMFSAADEEQWQIIQRHIEESDYYVVVIAHRYGSMTDDGISYTRKEYEYARGIGVPVLGFIIDDSATWLPKFIDRTNPAKRKLQEFKSLVREKPVGTWISPEDLHGKVSIALMKAFNTTPREGWVRASSVAGPEVTAELTRLSAENAALRAAAIEAKRQSEADHIARLTKIDSDLRQVTRQFSYRYKSGDRSWQETRAENFRYLFEIIAPPMIVEGELNDLSHSLALHLRDDDSRAAEIIAINQFQDFLSELMALGLVEPSDRRHPVNDKSEYWRLSELGRQFLEDQHRRYIELQIAERQREAEVSKAHAKKLPAKKAQAKESPAKKSLAKKSPAKKSPAKKSAAKKSPATKSAGEQTES